MATSVADAAASYRRVLDRLGPAAGPATHAFAGLPVACRLEGPPLLGSAWAHLRLPAGTTALPRLRVDFDAARADLPADLAAIDPRTRPVGRGVCTVSGDGRFVGAQSGGVVMLLDRTRRQLAGWCPPPAEPSLGHLGKPFLPLLSTWLADEGYQVVHAGLVSDRGRGALLIGGSGTGKTTAALGCLLAGMAFLGDDSVALEERGDGRFVGHSLYGSAWLAPDHARRFARLERHLVRGEPVPAHDKLLVLLGDGFADRLAASAAIRACLVPAIRAGPETSVTPLGRGEALRRLAPGSLLPRFPRGGAAEFQRLGRLVAALPCFALEMGADPERIAPPVRELLARC